MKKIILLFLATLLTSTLFAEDTRVGLGIGISDNATSIRMPIDVPMQEGNNLRLEPELALDYIDSSGGKTSNFTIGSGLYMTDDIDKDIQIYFGMKALFISNDTTFGAVTTSSTNLNLSGLFGFEYFFHKKVSLGGEAGLGLNIGGTSQYGTLTAATLRYYF
jgi:hypothetical protein